MESDKSSVSPTKDPDIQKQRAILSNLLAKLNITGYESKSLLPEPGQRKKIQPNLTEKRVRRASSHSILPKDEKALSEDAPKSADDFLLKPKTLQKEGHISLDSGIEEKKKMPIKPFAKGSVPQGQRFFDAGTEKKPSGNFPELIGAKSTDSQKDKKKEQQKEWVGDKIQPYAPISLPFEKTKSEKIDLGDFFMNYENNQKSKEEICLVQFPRILPINSVEEKMQIDTENSVPEHKNEYDMLKNIKGKIGKMRVYKSGKVEIEISGIKYNLDPGIQSKMRQEIAAVDKDCKDIYMLGEIGKKMVLTPNIDSLLQSEEKNK